MDHDVVRSLSVRKETHAGPDVCLQTWERKEAYGPEMRIDDRLTAHVTTREFGSGFSLSSQTA